MMFGAVYQVLYNFIKRSARKILYYVIEIYYVPLSINSDLVLENELRCNRFSHFNNARLESHRNSLSIMYLVAGAVEILTITYYRVR